MTPFTQDQLKELLHYEPKTGVFTWRVNRSRNAKVGYVAGCFTNEGYRAIIVCQKNFREHRLAWFYVHGEWVDQIDHINRDRSDNRIENLRLVTRAENKQNSMKYTNNTSGYKGVSFFKAMGCWHAQIKNKGKRIHLGFFKNIEDAAAAYSKAADQYHSYNPLATNAM